VAVPNPAISKDWKVAKRMAIANPEMKQGGRVLSGSCGAQDERDSQEQKLLHFAAKLGTKALQCELVL